MTIMGEINRPYTYWQSLWDLIGRQGNLTTSVHTKASVSKQTERRRQLTIYTIILKVVKGKTPGETNCLLYSWPDSNMLGHKYGSEKAFNTKLEEKWSLLLKQYFQLGAHSRKHIHAKVI